MTSPAHEADERWTELADGNRVPRLALGVWQVPNGPECVTAVRWALELGYRHIDTAQAYGNEESVGIAMRESRLPREEVFVTTKFNPSKQDPAKQAELSLKTLGVEYLDLYLVHWPQGGPTRAWPGMQTAHERGHARSIGVSNFNVEELELVLQGAASPPVVNQLQFSPFEYRRELLEASRSHQIAVEAYSPLGTGRHLGDATVQDIAQSVGRTPAQVLLRWAVQHDLLILPKSTHRERIEENGQIFDFVLSEAQMTTLDALDRTKGTGRAVEHKWW